MFALPSQDGTPQGLRLSSPTIEVGGKKMPSPGGGRLGERLCGVFVGSVGGGQPLPVLAQGLVPGRGAQGDNAETR